VQHLLALRVQEGRGKPLRTLLRSARTFSGALADAQPSGVHPWMCVMRRPSSCTTATQTRHNPCTANGRAETHTGQDSLSDSEGEADGRARAPTLAGTNTARYAGVCTGRT